MTFSLSDPTARQLLKAGLLTLAFIAMPSQAQEASQWGSGKNLYDKVCGHCHDPAVGVGPEIGGRDLPEPYIRAVVRHGFRAMPAFPASYVDDESLALVTQYLASLPKPTPSR